MTYDLLSLLRTTHFIFHLTPRLEVLNLIFEGETQVI